MSLAKTYTAPVTLSPPDPRNLPRTAAEWQQHISQLQQWQQQLQAGSWQAPALLNSWTNLSGFSPAGFRVDLAGRVALRGALQAASQTLPSTLCTLPWAPQFHAILHALAFTGTVYTSARVDVDTSGNVILEALASGTIGTGWVSLDGLGFSLAP